MAQRKPLPVDLPLCCRKDIPIFALGISVHVCPPSVLSCHWYTSLSSARARGNVPLSPLRLFGFCGFSTDIPLARSTLCSIWLGKISSNGSNGFTIDLVREITGSRGSTGCSFKLRTMTGGSTSLYCQSAHSFLIYCRNIFRPVSSPGLRPLALPSSISLHSSMILSNDHSRTKPKTFRRFCVCSLTLGAFSACHHRHI